MTLPLPTKSGFLDVAFAERQADALVYLIRRQHCAQHYAQRRVRLLFYLESLIYAVSCSLLVVVLFSLHSCQQLDSIHQRLTGIEPELVLHRSPRP